MSEIDLQLRDAEPNDAKRIFDWANDDLVRRMSFSSTPIPWSSHKTWFAARLADSRCLFFVVEDVAHVPVAQVRFDVDGVEAVISISVAPEARGRGIGTAAIRLGTAEAVRRRAIERVNAYIKPDNRASVRAFEGAGYSEPASVEHAGVPALRMTWPR